MNILLTGGNGFIGSNIKSYLLKKNHRVFEIRNVKSNKNDQSIKSNIIFYDLKENNLDFLLEKLNHQNIEAVIHCAALTNPKANNREFLLTNTLGTDIIFLLCKKLNAIKFIYLSGLTIIGKPYNIPIRENHQVNPFNIYHASKYFGENIISLDKDDSVEKIILRITAPVGPNMPKNRFLSKLIADCNDNKKITLFGKGGRIQNYIHTNDICRFIEISLIKECKGIFNLGGSESISNLDLANYCIKKTNSKSKIEFFGEDKEENFKWIISMEKAKLELGFEPKYDLDYMVEEQIKYIK